MSRLTADGDNIYDEHDDPVGLAFDNPALAKLFAAAPQMREALEAIVQELLDGDTTSAQQIARHAGRAALKAADGETTDG